MAKSKAEITKSGFITEKELIREISRKKYRPVNLIESMHLVTEDVMREYHFHLKRVIDNSEDKKKVRADIKKLLKRYSEAVIHILKDYKYLDK